ncbi:MAG TPA: methyl-accepting chemotaxis protein [Spirochaetota bacterium]|nr:methyl-accepting chemotaxis protein [Spirochaetota bacterium]HRU66529.1 methyl-accepting chemotaxis protein [Spirochaetota bacterium]
MKKNNIKIIAYLNLLFTLITISGILITTITDVAFWIYISAGASFCLLFIQTYEIYIQNKSQQRINNFINEVNDIKTSLLEESLKIFDLIQNMKNNKFIQLNEKIEKLSFNTDNTDAASKENTGLDYYESLLYLPKEELQRITNFLKEICKVLESNNLKFNSIFKSLDTLCPSHFALDLSDEWNEFITGRFTKAFDAVKKSIHGIEEIQNEGVEYVQYILEILKGLKNKRTNQGDIMMEFFSKMRASQESFSIYLDYSSESFKAISVLMEHLEDITDKINMLSLNMSIEANKLANNNVFTVIAKELHSFSEQTMKYFEPLKKTINQNLAAIEKKKQEEQETIKQAQEYIDTSEKTLEEYNQSVNQFTELVDNVSKKLMKQEAEVRQDIFTLLEDMQKLAIIEEEIRHRNEFHEFMLIKCNAVIQNLLRDYKQCEGFNCIHRQNIFELLKNMITTADERVFLSGIYKKYLNKELEESEVNHGDVILF